MVKRNKLVETQALAEITKRMIKDKKSLSITINLMMQTDTKKL